MNTAHSPFPYKIRRLLEDQDLEGLVALLRQPANPGLRAQAATALGELGEIDATQDLVRAHLEDPEPQVQAAARHALTELLGNTAGMAIQAFKDGIVDNEPWLVAPPEEEDEDADEVEPQLANRLNLSDDEINGLVLIARHENNEEMRLSAIKTLARSNNSVLANQNLSYLALWADSRRLRVAALAALELSFGEEQARRMLASYYNAAVQEAADSGTPLEPPYDEELLENGDEDEGDAENNEDLQDEDLDQDDEDLGGEVEFDGVEPENEADEEDEEDSDQPAVVFSPAHEEMSTPWQSILAVLVIAMVVIVIFFMLVRP